MALITDVENYWELDEASGTRADDVGAINLVVSGTVGSTSGLGGTVANLTLDGGLESTSYPYLTHPCTISWWVNLSTAANDDSWQKCWRIYDADGGVNRLFSRMYKTTDASASFEVHLYDSAERTSSYTAAAIVSGAWHNCIVTVTSGHLATLYLDGVSTGWDVNPIQLDGEFGGSSNTPRFVIGAWEFVGQIAKFGFWSSVLSAEDIATLYGAGTPPSYPFGEGATITPGSIWPTVTM